MCCKKADESLVLCHDLSPRRCRCNSETGSHDESGAASTSVAFGAGERGNHQAGATVSVSLVPAKVYVSASAKAAAEAPEDVSGAAAGAPGAAKDNDADATAEPDG